MNKLNVFGSKPKLVGNSELLKHKGIKFFLYNDIDVTLGNCELYLDKKPYILISTFNNNIEAKEFIQQHISDIIDTIDVMYNNGFDNIELTTKRDTNV